ncbi:hypothetical protein FGO68_gene724 [Halteria grandinella]|uniref:Uncharacterized protein n=1 Tax=Halteria grandinella TaxID=5974 RepID=A0A8J8NP55_HALGN|nr:hypothetical protein FGO68_gene724 [Halteria grandinella]
MTLQEFDEKSGLNFVVKGYNYKEMKAYPLSCDQCLYNILYFYSREPPLNFQLNANCIEKEGILFFDLMVEGNENKATVLENMQYLDVQITYSKIPNTWPQGTFLYFIYKGSSRYFSGREINQQDFSSLDLQFGNFYKTQVMPFILDTLENKVVPELPFLNKRQFDLNFQFQEPYFTQPNILPSTQLHIYFKFNNDNNPFTRAKVRPATYFDGVLKVIGLLGLINLANKGMAFYDKQKYMDQLIEIMEKEKQSEVANGRIQDSREITIVDEEWQNVDKEEMVQEYFSYEKIARLFRQDMGKSLLESKEK